MNITVICVGKLKDKNLEAMTDEYARRLGSGVKLKWIEAPDEKLKNISLKEAMKKEARRIIEKLPKGSAVIALDAKGGQKDSEGFARLIEKNIRLGKDICFIIGGPVGLDQSILDRADRTLSLSKLTFPHRMVRLILAEQIYRAFSIIRGEPYHK